MPTKTLQRDLDIPLSMPGSPRWFSAYGCTVTGETHVEVFIAGSLIGVFEHGDRASRDVLLLGVSEDRTVRRGKLAAAFGVSAELLRQLRNKREVEGLESIVHRQRVGAPRKCTAKLRKRIEGMLDEGHTIDQVQRKLKRGRVRVSRALVGFVRSDWAMRGGLSKAPAGQVPADGVTVHEAAAGVGVQGRLAIEGTGNPPDSTVSARSEEADSNEPRTVVPTAVQDGESVQHAGVWLLLGLLDSWGIYDVAREAVGSHLRIGASTLRIALDAAIAAFAIGERSVEGVRRLRTATAAVLLRVRQCPSAPWVRSVLARAASADGGVRFHFGVAGHFIAEANARGSELRPAVFYVDNHMRPYTGHHTVRTGWRMQDRRARPGVSDYWVHDEDGRPIMRIDVPDHGSLTQWLPALADGLREALGPDARILVGFDRAGAFPEHLAGLRNTGFEFVTYERKPYPQLRHGAFDTTFADGEETIGVCDARCNLGKGRGRVRRVSLLMPDGHQVNLLAISELDPESLYRIARGRWRQENGFKHENQRWGLNQLDGRATVTVPPETVIPNPARRRLDRAIGMARHQEGALRCKLEAATKRETRAALQQQINEVVARRDTWIAQRPHIPTHAPLMDTDLAGKLVRHPGEYKMFLDTLRVALANAESELAALVGPLLPRSAEAKKVLANLFSAPAQVSVSRIRITLTLTPAGTVPELDAISVFLEQCSAMNFSLPGDNSLRTLAFRLSTPNNS